MPTSLKVIAKSGCIPIAEASIFEEPNAGKTARRDPREGHGVTHVPTATALVACAFYVSLRKCKTWINHHPMNKEEIAHGRFREDLYYRLYVFPITIPPLRERREDIPLLINHFVKKYSARTAKKIETVSPNVIETLQAYDWPGNVRELENVIERAVIVSQGKQLKLDDWLPHTNAKSDASAMLTLEDMERHHILKVLEQTGWRISGERGAAKRLNINASTLRSRMEKLGIKK